jgi:hypothetical protein
MYFWKTLRVNGGRLLFESTLLAWMKIYACICSKESLAEWMVRRASAGHYYMKHTGILSPSLLRAVNL